MWHMRHRCQKRAGWCWERCCSWFGVSGEQILELIFIMVCKRELGNGLGNLTLSIPSSVIRVQIPGLSERQTLSNDWAVLRMCESDSLLPACCSSTTFWHTCQSVMFRWVGFVFFNVCWIRMSLIIDNETIPFKELEAIWPKTISFESVFLNVQYMKRQEVY